MPLIRTAQEADFQAIYNLQQGPFRREVFDSPPVPFEEFASHSGAQIRDGLEHYFVMEEEGVVSSFVWFQLSEDLWFTLIWGRWLRTLVYAGCVIGFRHLNFAHQYFWVRQKNRRMIRIGVDPGYGFRKIGEDAGYALRDDADPPLVVVRSDCFEILRTIYLEKEDYYRNQSLPLTFEL